MGNLLDAEVLLTHNEANFTFGVIITTGHHGSHRVIDQSHHMHP